jgi:hypothetical protein
MIARRKTPMAKSIPIGRKGKREFAAMRGKIDIGPEFVDPLPDEELDHWDQ